MLVRLDIWHFMRRLAIGVTSESHPMFATFMSRLTSCIFEWDAQDYSLLLSAKRSSLQGAGMRSPSDAAVRKAVTSNELALHCRRKTRGTCDSVGSIRMIERNPFRHRRFYCD